MSSRIRKSRKVFSPPAIKGFKPYGIQGPGADNPEAVTLKYEEYESLRLCDYDRYNHHQASVLMGISRPTYTRIYASAREKIATAFVEGRQISVEGGKVHFDTDWFHCTECGCYFTSPDTGKGAGLCPLCGSNDIASYEPGDSDGNRTAASDTDRCVCISCGYEKEHSPGRPCSQELCPECNMRMRRMNGRGNKNRGKR